MCRFLAAALLWNCLSVFAQQPGTPVIRVDVREVLVPVIVTDNKGHHVTGLKASDFRIQEDGVAQDLASFSTDTVTAANLLFGAPDRAASAGTPTQPPPAGPLRHNFVICLDSLHSAFANSTQLRDALKALFEKEKPSEAQYSMVAVGRQLQVLQTATSDPAAVASRLRSPAFQSALGGHDTATFSSELNDLKNRMYDFCRRCPACGSSSNYRACDSQVENLKTGLDAQAEHWAQLTNQLLTQLKMVAEELAKLPTGRTLILISDGFSLQPAREFYAVAGSFLSADPRFKMAAPTNLEASLQAVIKVAVEKNIRIYSLDSRGVAQSSFTSNGSMDASSPADRSAPSVIGRSASSNRGGTLLSGMDREAASVARENGGAMEQMAQATGGVYFHESNDMLKQFRAALADGREYYLLGYVPRNPASDHTFRAVRVEVADKKLHVQAKSGYWAAEN